MPLAFFLRKLTAALAAPLGICGLLILLGALTRKRRLVIGSIAFLWIISAPLVAERLFFALEHAYPARPVADCPPADAIVVLSGGIVTTVNAAGIQWGAPVGRYFEGVSLMKAGKAPLLIFTSALLSDHSGRTEAEVEKQDAVRQGIPPDQIQLTGRVLTTEDEAREVARLPRVRSIILVTSAFHMPRAALLFRCQGLAVTPYPADFRVSHPEVGPLSFIPTATGLDVSDTVIREMYGLLFYHLRCPRTS